MATADNGPLLETMTWYNDLFRQVESESDSVKEIIGKIKLSVLEALSKRGLFEMIRRKYEAVETTSKTFYPSKIAEAILWRVVLTIDAQLFGDYFGILKNNNGIVEQLWDEKKRQLKINNFVEKHKDIME
jgi:hypothetical protein